MILLDQTLEIVMSILNKMLNNQILDSSNLSLITIAILLLQNKIFPVQL